jgi:hypothetical protein
MVSTCQDNLYDRHLQEMTGRSARVRKGWTAGPSRSSTQGSPCTDGQENRPLPGAAGAQDRVRTAWAKASVRAVRKVNVSQDSMGGRPLPGQSGGKARVRTAWTESRFRDRPDKLPLSGRHEGGSARLRDEPGRHGQRATVGARVQRRPVRL